MSPSAPSLNSASGHASGKVILFGEHAVVHGATAIAAGMSRGVTARAQAAESDAIWFEETALPSDHELLTGLASLRRELQVGPAHIHLTLEIPAGSGLGSSAAMAVATARALLALNQKTAPDTQVFEAAQSWERVFHGNPSGVDVAAAQSNSAITYTRGELPQPLILGKSLHLVIAQAGPPASTKEMVAGVARCKERNPTHFAQSLEAISSLTQNAVLLLRSGDLQAVGKLMDLNHMLLAGWMLSTEEIETSCHVAREAGALGVKITGAGGGGCTLALAADKAAQEKILSAYIQYGIKAFPTQVGL